ncbi:MAG: GNAT family N-acetyltransferase [Devosiaceae bacterium]|nr:GNAT family N-acetyltransferase [Devosiaceae bacterium]
MKDQIKISMGFPEHLRSSAAKIYFDAFENKIGWLLGGRTKAISYLEKVMDPSFAICAIDTSNSKSKILGIAGFKIANGSMIGGGFSSLVLHYGFFSALWRTIFLLVLEREIESDVLLMDGIAVTPDQRGKGIGSKLLDAIADHARQNGYKIVRLDVIDSNSRARALYERKGFELIRIEEMGPLKHLYGFSSAATMLLKL